MKTYSRQEKETAKQKLPPALADFLDAPVLPKLYLGIRDKMKLNLRQLMVMCEIANVTLLGLEPESALETNLHQYLPELSNADMRELTADLNDRVFKEARRRVQENVRENKNEIPKAESGDAEDEDDFSVRYPAPYVPIARTAELADAAPEGEPNAGQTDPESDEKSASIPRAPTIVEEKLGAPTESKPETVLMGEKSAAPAVATAQKSPSTAYHGQDPYREPVE